MNIQFRNAFILPVIIIIVMNLSWACSIDLEDRFSNDPDPSRTPTNTPTDIPTNLMPTWTPTITPTYTMTQTPTMTPTPTNTLTQTPTPTMPPGWGPEESLGVDGEFLDMVTDHEGNIYLCYHRGYTLYLKWKRVYGGTWSAEIAVDGSQDDTAWRFYHRMAVDSINRIHFVWVSYNWTAINYNCWDKTNWLGKQAVISGQWPINRPDIAVARDDAICIVSQKDFGIAATVNEGQGWSTPMYIYYNEPSEPQAPRLSVTPNGGFHCAFSTWWNDAAGKGEIGYCRYVRATGTWTNAVNPKTVSGYPNNVTLLTAYNGSADIIWLEWQDNSVNYDRLGHLYLENGQWSSVQYLVVQSNLGTEDVAPTCEIVINDSPDPYRCISYATFSDTEHKVYCMFEQNAHNWTNPIRITDANSDQFYPAIATSGADFYFAWRDTRGGIYFRPYISP